MHDQLGANLTQVALLGELAEADKDLPGEVELHAKPMPALDLRATMGLLDSKYQDLFLHFANRSGNQLIMAPPFSAGLVADWRVARFAAGGSCAGSSAR